MHKKPVIWLLGLLLLSASCGQGKPPILTNAHLKKTSPGMTYTQVVKVLGFEGTEVNASDGKYRFGHNPEPCEIASYTWDIEGHPFTLLFIDDKAFFGCLTTKEELRKSLVPRVENKSYEEVVKIIGKEGTPSDVKGYRWQGAQNTAAEAWFADNKLLIIEIGQHLTN
jgi:hypothetical protein